MATNLPFALFVFVDLDEETINKVIKDAIGGATLPLFWLASNKYEEAPIKKENETNLGTDPPIAEGWTSAWVGKRVDDAVKWLQEKPSSVDLDSHHFAVLDANAVEGSVVICKIGDKKLEGDQITMVRKAARHSSTFLAGLEYYEWEEQFEGRGGEKNHAEIDYGDVKIDTANMMGNIKMTSERAPDQNFDSNAPSSHIH